MTRYSGNTKAIKLAKRLNRRHAVLGSWRAVAAEYNNPKIKFGTLERIAKSGGAYVPVDKELQDILGLKRKPNPYRRLKRIFDQSPAELRWRLENREAI